MSSVSPTAARNGQLTARLFHALADETRLRILEQLADGEQCVCDLTGNRQCIVDREPARWLMANG